MKSTIWQLSHMWLPLSQPAHTWDVTGKGSNVLQAIVDTGLSSARFYQASSSEMFGSLRQDRNGEKYQNEKQNLCRIPYAIAKTAPITLFVSIGMFTTFMLVLVFCLITKDQEGVITSLRKRSSTGSQSSSSNISQRTFLS